MIVAAAFLASMLFGIIFDVPPRALVGAAVAGTASWTLYTLLQGYGMGSVGATFVATLASGLYAELMARIGRNPVTVFIVPGIIPLVPGAGAYYTMLYLVKSDFSQGLSMGMQTMMLAGAIAAGVALISIIFRVIGRESSGMDVDIGNPESLG
ncbi:MAG TPA: threonine/serine exporter family protein [Bacillota bacterium]|nr:threonine/serine exporter family protein [Bacillota bacterium]